jgi:hypothetical protein
VKVRKTGLGQTALCKEGASELRRTMTAADHAIMARAAGDSPVLDWTLRALSRAGPRTIANRGWVSSRAWPRRRASGPPRRAARPGQHRDRERDH